MLRFAGATVPPAPTSPPPPGPRRRDSPRVQGPWAGRCALRPAGVPAQAQRCFLCSGKVSGSPGKLQPELEEEGEGEGKGGVEEGGEEEGEEEEEGESPASARVFHVYKLTPPRPSLAAHSSCQSPGSLCLSAHPFLPLWEPCSKHLFRFGS